MISRSSPSFLCARDSSDWGVRNVDAIKCLSPDRLLELNAPNCGRASCFSVDGKQGLASHEREAIFASLKSRFALYSLRGCFLLCKSHLMWTFTMLIAITTAGSTSSN